MIKSQGKHITINFLHSFQPILIAIHSSLPSAPCRHKAGGYCFAFLRCGQVAPSGAIIGAGTTLGAGCAASCSGPMLRPTGKPTSGALLPLSSGGTSCAPSGAIETSSLY
jgi:hypothetical protein